MKLKNLKQKVRNNWRKYCIDASLSVALVGGGVLYTSGLKSFVYSLPADGEYAVVQNLKSELADEKKMIISTDLTKEEVVENAKETYQVVLEKKNTLAELVEKESYQTIVKQRKRDMERAIFLRALPGAALLGLGIGGYVKQVKSQSEKRRQQENKEY